MNDIKILRFDTNDLVSIGTRNLNGCSVVMVVSVHGAILGHIAPRPSFDMTNPTAGDDHATMMMNRMTSIYYENQQYFPVGSNSWVVCVTFDGEVGLPDQQRIFERALSDLRLPYFHRAYPAGGRRDAFPGQGTCFIRYNGNCHPPVYVEDVEVSAELSPRGGSPRGSAAAQTSRTSPLSVGAAGTTSSQASSDVSSGPAPYYCVEQGRYYYRANGQSTRLPAFPSNVWVYNERGWQDSGYTKKWCRWTGSSYEYTQ
jgi:hypothetical protein